MRVRLSFSDGAHAQPGRSDANLIRLADDSDPNYSEKLKSSSRTLETEKETFERYAEKYQGLHVTLMSMPSRWPSSQIT